MLFSFYYENLHDLYRTTFPLMIVAWCLGGAISYRFRGRRSFYRTLNFTPLALRIKAKLNNTSLGKINLLFHVITNKLKYKHLIDFSVKRHNNAFYHRFHSFFKYFSRGLITAFMINEAFARNGGNLFFNRRIAEINQNMDYSKKIITYAQNPNIANDVLLSEIELKLKLAKGIKNKKILEYLNYNEIKDTKVNFNGKENYSSDLDLILKEMDFLQYGKLMSSVFQEEVAAQCYYIAYLSNRNIKANSEMKFDTKSI